MLCFETAHQKEVRDISKYKYTIDLEIRSFIEYQLRYFHENKRQLESLKNDMIPSQISQYGYKAGSSFDPEQRPTEETAVKIATDRYIFQLELTVTAIDSVISALPDLDKELIRLKYWDGKLTPEGIALKLNMGRTTVYEHLNNILVEIARRLGYIVL